LIKSRRVSMGVERSRRYVKGGSLRTQKEGFSVGIGQNGEELDVVHATCQSVNI